MKKRMSFKEPESKRSARSIRVPVSTLDVLEAHRLAQKKQRLTYASITRTTTMMFCEVDGSVASRPIHQLILHAGGYVQEHGRTFICCAILTRLNYCMQEKSAMCQRLSHATVAFALDVYGHVIPTWNRMQFDNIGANVEL